MLTSRNQLRNNQGLTLIELMISIAIGALFLVMIVQIYFGVKEAEQLQTAINDIEFNAKRTISILSSELKRAGHIGCAHLTADFPLEKNTIISNQTKLLGTDDGIQVKYVDLPSVVLKEMSGDTLLVSNEKQFKENDLLMISDCQKAEVFSVKQVKMTADGQTQMLMPLARLNHVYEDNAEIGRVVSNRYFIHDDNDVIRSLTVEDINHKKITLVDHVTQLSFVYTIKYGDEVREVKANEVADWSQVIGVAADIKVMTDIPALEKVWHMYVALSP